MTPPSTVKPPVFTVLPTTSEPAVIALKSAAVILKVALEPATEIDLLPLGSRVTVPLLAFTDPLNCTSFAVIIMGELVELIAVEPAFVTLPVPSVVNVTPPVPDTFPFNVIDPLEPDDVCRVTVPAEIVLDVVIDPLVVNCTDPDAAVTAPVTEIDPAVALRAKVEPFPADEALRVIGPEEESVIPTLPAEFAVRLVALVDGMVIPPLPLVSESVGVVKVDVLMVPLPAGLALSVIEDKAERGADSVMLPPVEESEMLGADTLESPVSVIELAEVTWKRPFVPQQLMEPPRLTPPLVDVRLITFAERADMLVSVFLAIRLMAPIQPVAA